MPRRNEDRAVGPRRRLLVPCHELSLAGGLLRFERAGAALRRAGHELAFVPLASRPRLAWKPSHPVLSLSEARSASWDATMLPGGGFRDESLEALERLAGTGFGLRVLHVLNDPSRLAKFERVCERFVPDMVIFNSEHWRGVGLGRLKARAFHTLVGAIDTREFQFRPPRGGLAGDGRWIVGGLASKNPGPLVEALRLLPETVALRLFGEDRDALATHHPDLAASGRLQFAGALRGPELPAFYAQVDCVAMTEIAAGWSNLSAEAMASGVPLVCTRAGTLAFARHEDTALVLGEPAPAAIADAVLRLRGDEALRTRLAAGARRAIEGYTWERYARELLELLFRPVA